jgi:hypothetical protein
MILQFRPGSGGKMLLLCLMTIDQIAHWDPDVEKGNISHVQSLEKYWNSHTIGGWVQTEPVVQWNKNFYSRVYSRGDEITADEYNHLMNIDADSYFRECWSSNKIMLDYLHKSFLPIWYQGSRLLKLDAEWEDPCYREILLSKLYYWDSVSRKGISLLDHPDYQPSVNNVIKFNNQIEFGPFDNSDQWLEFVKESYPLFKFSIDSPDLMMSDLFYFDRVEHFIQSVANSINGKFDIDVLKATHNHWITKQEEFIKLNLPKKKHLTINSSSSTINYIHIL